MRIQNSCSCASTLCTPYQIPSQIQVKSVQFLALTVQAAQFSPHRAQQISLILCTKHGPLGMQTPNDKFTPLFRAPTRQNPAPAPAPRTDSILKQPAHRLWKEVPTKTPASMVTDAEDEKVQNPDLNLLSPLAHKAISQVDENSIGMLETQLTPIGKMREKSPTISNFLQQLQCEKREDSYYDRFGTESEIVSVLDINYNDGHDLERGYLNRHHRRGSFFIETKFHVNLEISALRQAHSLVKQELKAYITKAEKDYQVLIENCRKLGLAYEAQINNKSMQLRGLQLKVRELRLNNAESNYRLENQLLQSEEKNGYLDSANKSLQGLLAETDKKRKQQEEQLKNEKNHNKELNEIILKLHKKIQELEQKVVSTQKQNEEARQAQLSKITQKYKQMLREQEENYQLKLENSQIMLMNMQGSMYMSRGSDRDRSIDMTPEEIALVTLRNNRNSNAVQQTLRTSTNSRAMLAKFRFSEYEESGVQPEDDYGNMQSMDSIREDLDQMGSTDDVSLCNSNNLSYLPQFGLSNVKSVTKLRDQTQSSHAAHFSPKSVASNRRFQRTNKCPSPQNPNSSIRVANKNTYNTPNPSAQNTNAEKSGHVQRHQNSEIIVDLSIKNGTILPKNIIKPNNLVISSKTPTTKPGRPGQTRAGSNRLIESASTKVLVARQSPREGRNSPKGAINQASMRQNKIREKAATQGSEVQIETFDKKLRQTII